MMIKLKMKQMKKKVMEEGRRRMIKKMKMGMMWVKEEVRLLLLSMKVKESRIPIDFVENVF